MMLLSVSESNHHKATNQQNDTKPIQLALKQGFTGFSN
jgi:hypothetical protein